MKIAVEGCCHGELDNIYAKVAELEQRNNYKVDALLICGDFQAMRNSRDLESMACPRKYKKLGIIQEAPLLTLVVGGNHEASNYMWELFHGGWLAPNIYYMGSAGAVRLNGVRIAGMSGIFKYGHDHLGFYERLPYDSDTMRSVYHTREFNVRRLSSLGSCDMFFGHDWPRSVALYGNIAALVKDNYRLKQDIENNVFGSPQGWVILKTLKPSWYFAGHMHTHFEALVPHDDPTTSTPGLPAQETKFLALDKCLPGRKFLEVIDFPISDDTASDGHGETGPSEPRLAFDPDWLAITRVFHGWMSVSRGKQVFPKAQAVKKQLQREKEWVSNTITTDERGEIPISSFQTFSVVAPPPGSEGDVNLPPIHHSNPQTVAFCKMIDIPNKIDTTARST